MNFRDWRWIAFGMVPAMTASWFLFGEYEWGFTFIGIALVVLIGEIISLRRDGITLSARFWRKAEHEPENALLIIMSLAIAMLILLLHLGFPSW